MSMARSKVSNEMLKDIRDKLLANGQTVYAWRIQKELKSSGLNLDVSTIRGRFIEMGEPISQTGNLNLKQKQQEPQQEIKSERKDPNEVITKTANHDDIPQELRGFVPKEALFKDYLTRFEDNKLAIHYNIGVTTGNHKYPITQGKQGTGKTMAHLHYAFTQKLPFFLYSCHDDFKLRKLFGDKTIVNGTIVFKESLFVKALQSPSVILFDEINAVSNENTFDFHALLQNRELFIKDADNGNGKLYKLHPECRIGFAQNPKSAKYIGGNIKPSNFLGRCTFITFPEFKKTDIKKIISERFPKLHSDDVKRFSDFYFACLETIERSQLPLDISIRQLNNVIELWLNGLELSQAIADGLSSMLEAISQPNAKESFHTLAEAVWKDLMNK